MPTYLSQALLLLLINQYCNCLFVCVCVSSLWQQSPTSLCAVKEHPYLRFWPNATSILRTPSLPHHVKFYVFGTASKRHHLLLGVSKHPHKKEKLEEFLPFILHSRFFRCGAVAKQA